MDSLPETSIEGVKGRSAEQASLRSSSRDSSGITEYDDHKAENTSDEPCEHTEPETTDAEVNPDSETCRYMERLVRTHLEDVMEPDRNAHIPLSDPLFKYGPQDLFSRLATVFAKSNDIVLARLLKAVISVYCTAQSGLTESIENLFRHTHQLLVPLRESGLDETLTFLYTVIEQLAHQEADGNLRSTQHESDSTTVSSIIVSVSDDTKEIAFEDILPFFWNSRLETDCHHCHQPFEDEPPIRTIAQGNALVQMLSSTLQIKVFNRHFACVQASRTLIVPVSHVWDDSIRIANASKTHNDDAAWTMLGTLETLFKGAQDAYEPDVEFWHDYFSVPQWKPKTKDALLLCLPAIYNSSDEILVHMSDLPTNSVLQSLTNGGKRDVISVKQAVQRILILSDISNTQWMQRMWVTLEYSQAKAACVMDQSNKIWRQKEVALGHVLRDTFTQLLNNEDAQFDVMYRWASHIMTKSGLTNGVLGRLTINKGEDQGRPLCLGEVMNLVSQKQCQIPRDRFIAIHIILTRISTPKDTPIIAGTDTDACLWVWRSALSKADYSPLLLHPRKCVSSSDPESPLPSWLVGNRSVDQAAWDLASQETAPIGSLLVTEVSVKAVLGQVGEIRAIHYMDKQVAGNVEGVSQVLRMLVAIAQTAGFVLSPENLYDAIDNVFPITNQYKNAMGVRGRKPNMVFSFNERLTQDPEFNTKLSEHLDLYVKMSEEGKTAHVLEAAQSVAKLLQLDTYYAEGQTRLLYSKGNAYVRAQRSAVKGEPLCEVTCPECHKTAILRLDLRETGNVGDIVYHIPGLSYQFTGDNVGLVLRNGRITGRMLFGKPACNCQLQETVEIF
jgi:hypothetical protein